VGAAGKLTAVDTFTVAGSEPETMANAPVSPNNAESTTEATLTLQAFERVCVAGTVYVAVPVFGILPRMVEKLIPPLVESLTFTFPGTLTLVQVMPYI
jgi:hypothetical protein